MPGEAYLWGKETKWEADNVAIGYQGSAGKISIENGAYMDARGLYMGYEAGSRGELLITGQSGGQPSAFWTLGTNVIGRLGPAEIKVLDGGLFLHGQSVNLS